MAAWAFLAPSALHLAAFCFVPLLLVLYVSVHRWRPIEPTRAFVALANYEHVVRDPLVWSALGRTLLYALYVPVSMALALGLALAVGGRRRSGAPALRALFLLPYASSVVAVALVWQWMYHPDFGLINHLLTRSGLRPVNWLGDPRTALAAVMLVSVWIHLGYQVTVLLAGLRAIPQTYLDAARAAAGDPHDRSLPLYGRRRSGERAGLAAPPGPRSFRGGAGGAAGRALPVEQSDLLARSSRGAAGDERYRGVRIRAAPVPGARSFVPRVPVHADGSGGPPCDPAVSAHRRARMGGQLPGPDLDGAGVGHRDISPAAVLPRAPPRPRGRRSTRGCGRVDDFLAGDRAVVAARPCHARCARVRRAVEELSLAARCHALDRDATGRGGHRESGGHVPCELVVPDGERDNGRHPVDGAVFRGADVFPSCY